MKDVTMNIADTLVGTLDFERAITMAELTERAQEVMQRAPFAQAQTDYNEQFKHSLWQCVHPILHTVYDSALRRSVQVWVLILQREGSGQFAVVCGYDQAAALPTATTNVPQTPRPANSIPVINANPKAGAASFLNGLGLPANWLEQLDVNRLWNTVQEWIEDHSVLYDTAPMAGTQPPIDAKVYQPWLAACHAVQEEINLFFRALGNSKIAAAKLAQVTKRNPALVERYRAAIGSALALRFGAEISAAMVETIVQEIQEQAEDEISAWDIPSNYFTEETDSLPHWQLPETGFAITFVGHGAGGAVATLCALFIQRIWRAKLDFPPFALEVYALGSPKIGNRAFVRYYNQQMHGNTYRVQNMLDSFTYYPSNELPRWQALPDLTAGVGTMWNQLQRQVVIYEHVGNAFRHPGVGNAPTRFHFASGTKPPSLPFDHDAAGYKALLIDAKEQLGTVAKPFAAVTQQLERWFRQTNAAIADSSLAGKSSQSHQTIAVSPLATAKHDKLTKINGIGPTYQQRLYAAGIITFADVADTSAERLSEICNVQEWQDVDVVDWKVQARQLI